MGKIANYIMFSKRVDFHDQGENEDILCQNTGERMILSNIPTFKGEKTCELIKSGRNRFTGVQDNVNRVKFNLG